MKVLAAICFLGPSLSVMDKLRDPLGTKNEPPKCPRCREDMFLAKATNFGPEYWYCRNCKKELEELMIPEPVVKAPSPSCVHDWNNNTDHCKVCGITGLEYYSVKLLLS